MATYKVLQDIEAEDKFVGPLTLKQFILACITLGTGYLCVFFLIHHIWVLDIPLLPIVLFTGFLAWPWGRDQPTEVWLLAKLRFMLKPRRRIWDQSGIQELVTITAPKHLEELYSGNNLSQGEVKSRLRALADTIDSRGWAVKNVNVNLYAEPSYGAVTQDSDRLVAASSLATEVPNSDIQAADDIMDERSNPIAQHLNQMISASTQAHRQETLQQLQDIRDHKKPQHSNHSSQNGKADEPPADYWFMNQSTPPKLPKDYATFTAQTVHPGTQDDNTTTSGPLTSDEQQLLNKVHSGQQPQLVAYGQTPVLQPIGKQKSHHKHSATDKKGKTKHAKASMTAAPDPAILNLANNDDLTVATLAREANKKSEPELPKGEVIVPLR